MIQGEIQTLPIADLIQWLALTRRTGKLVMGQQEDQNLIFYFDKGQIAAATKSDLSALDNADKLCTALSVALAWRRGRFTFNDCALPALVLTANLKISSEAVLVKAAAQRKEQEREAAEPHPGEEVESYSETFTLADSLRLQVVGYLLKEDFTVPVLPQLAARVLELTRDENFSLRDLGNLVLTDQTVAARILRYANSVFHATERSVDSLALAVQRLGANEVVNIVLAATLQTLRLKQDRFTAERQRVHRQSAVTAFYSRALTGRAGLNSNLGFLCGLLMDFGTTVLYSIIQQALGQGPSAKPLPAGVIEEIVRDYHPRVGRTVGEKWRLPSPVVETMAYHHCHFEDLADKPYVALASLADVLAHFALKTPRGELKAALAQFLPELLLTHPATQFIDLSLNEARAVVIEDLARCLDQALEFVVD